MSSRKVKGVHFDGKIAGLYDLEETIGKGHFAVVKLARHVFTGEKVAVKVIDKTKLDDISKAHLFQEVRCMKLVQHPNVVRLYEVIDTQTKLYLILELGDGGDMYDYIMKHNTGLNEDVARRHFRQIVQAIHYCHKLHVVHRDLKPENVVFFQKLGIVKLTDFGFSNKFVPGKQLETSCGSLAYSAPEILLGDSYDAPAVDVWSLGVILFMLVVGEAPFQEANDSETLTMILDCKYRIPPGVSEECRALIARLLVREPENRASLQDILYDPWLQQGEVSSIPIMPLMSRQLISEDDHAVIVQKMVDGKIASKEEILQSLEKDAYDHITATYYLLAERRLKRQREYQALAGQRRQLDSDKANLAPLALSPRSAKEKFVDGVYITCTCEDPSEQCPCVQAAKALQQQKQQQQQQQQVAPAGGAAAGKGSRSPSPGDRGFISRRISLIQEESIEEDEEEMPDGAGSGGGGAMRQSRSTDEYLSDDSCDSRSASTERNAAGANSDSPTKSQPRRQGMRPLHSVRSSPQLLNQIFEEGESEDDDDLSIVRKNSSPLYRQRSGLTSPDMIRKYEHQTRKKRLTSGSRGTSCSSSDASDTDETDSRKRKEKLKQRMQRRDSSDHSSDTDGPNGPGGPGGAGRFPDSGAGQRDGSGRDRDNNRDRDRDHDRNNRDRNDENRPSRSKERRGGGKQNGTFISKKESTNADTNSHTSELGRKLSNLSFGSNISIGSLSGKSGKYLVESSVNNTPKSSGNKDVSAMNEENKARAARIIQVRSKDFSDLVERFAASGGKDDAMAAKDVSSSSKLRRRSKDKIKTDINRNGLITRSDGEMAQLETIRQEQNVVKTKCCSLV